ncbi:MAG: hypothetical protein KGI54_08695 [Pseudomonadota bacterium]|nr:hypothetical protein [Pseudomonadota bacterium]
MATLDQLNAALIKADAAGNTDDARAFASEIRKMREASPVTQEQPAPRQARTPILGSLLSGGLRGAGEIGATILRALPNALGGDTAEQSTQRRADINAAVDSLNEGLGVSQPLETVGKLGTEIAGTAGAGGAIAKGMTAIPQVAKAAPNLINAIQSAGMTAGKAGPGLMGGLENLATRAAGGAITGGASAGMINPNEAGMGAALGGGATLAMKGLGAVGGAVGDKLGNALRLGVSDDVANLAKRAKELGIDIPADRLTNSRPLNAIASSLNYVPFSGRAATEEKMASQLNQALSKTFGQDSSNVTMALRKADTKLGGEFDNTLKNTGVIFDKELMDDVARIETKADKELGSDAFKPIKSKIDDLFEKGQSGAIDGQAAYNIKRELDRIGKGNTPEAFHALELKSALMEALNRSLGPEKAAAFAKTRQQYGNMLALEKLAKNGAEGEVSAARLANMKNINNQPLQELADIAAQFVKPREGQHGAAQIAAAGALTFGLAGAPGVAAGVTTGRMANALLNSNALKQHMLNESKPGKLAELLKNQNAQRLLLQSAPVISAQ